MEDFQCRARIINRLFGAMALSSEADIGLRQKGATEGEFWQQQSALRHKKRPAQRRPFQSWELR
jgi:hypothetical protein